MDDRSALHTAARRYCQDRFSYWMQKYQELQAKENWQVENLFQPGWDYSAAAYRIFPRYRVDKSIQVEVEKLRPDSSPTLDDLRTQLLHACDIVEASLHAELKNPIARETLHEEADDFKAYIQILGTKDLADIEGLPFRRVLREEESKRLRTELKSTWGIDGYPWFPLKEEPVPPNVMTFHEDYLAKIEGLLILRNALKERNIERIFLLHEFTPEEPDYEVESSIFEPIYGGGGEQYSTSEPTDWVVYASHESSIAICGDWLTRTFADRFPDWREHTYRGPCSTADLRGTWDWK